MPPIESAPAVPSALPPSNDSEAAVAVSTSPLPPGSEVGDDDDDDAPVDVKAGLDGLTVDQLVALEAAGNDPAAIAAALGTTEEAAPAAPEPVIEEEVPAAPAAPKAPGARISLNGLQDDDRAMVMQAVGAVKSGQFVSVAEAMAGLYPDKLPAAPAPAPVSTDVEPTPAPVPVDLDPPQELIDLQAKLTTIDAEIDEANDVFDHQKATKLLRERQELVRKVDKMEASFESSKAAYQSLEAAVDASSNRVIAQYPQLAVEGSPEFIAVENAIIVARVKEPDIFGQSDWPEQIAKRTLGAAQGNGGAVANPPGQVQQPKIPAPTPSGVRLPGSLIGPGTQTLQPTAISAVTEMEGMDPDDVIRILELADRKAAR